MDRWRWMAWAVLAGTCGCGGAETQPTVIFPSKDELQKLAARPASPKSSLDTTPVDRWKIESAVPAPGAPYPEDEAWDRILVERKASGSTHARLAPELRCTAREAARFYVENGAFPEDALREYLLLRCGSTMVSATMRSVTGAVPESATELELERSYHDSVRELITRSLEGATEMGLGFARGKGRAAIVTFYGTPQGRLRTVPALVQGTRVTLEGEAAPDASFVLGLATQGPLGVALCEPDTTVKAPAFRLWCPVAEEDTQTRIDVEMHRPGQVLMRSSLELLVRRQADAGLTYQGLAYGPTAPAPTAAAFRDGILAGLNSARSEAGARALSIEPNQSQDSDSLVSQYFDSSLRGDAAAVDTMALGLLAGWDVGGTIRDGGFYSKLAPSSRSPGRWVGHALASPGGRWSLLDGKMARAAIGAGLLGPSGAMGLVTTYAFFESSDHRPDEDAVFEKLVGARKDRGAPPPNRVPGDANLEHALSRIMINATSTGAAFQDVMQHIAYDEHRSARGWYVETSDLKDLPFGDDLLVRAPIDVQIGVTHHKAPGGAWGQYVVLISILGKANDTKEAALAGHPVATAPGPSPMNTRTH